MASTYRHSTLSLLLFAAASARSASAQTTTPKFVYVTANYLVSTVAVCPPNPYVLGFTVDANTGGPTPIPGSPFNVGGFLPIHVTSDPLGRFLWVLSEYTSCTTPYLTNGAITSYKVDSATGALTQTGSAPSSSFEPLWTSTDAAGKFLFAANFCLVRGSCAGEIDVYSIDQTDGTLTSVAGSPFAAQISQSSAIAIDPNAQLAFVGGQGAVSVLSFNSNGQLGLAAGPYLSQSPAPSNTGFTGIDDVAIDPTGKFAIGLNRCNSCPSNLEVWSIGANGILTPLGITVTNARTVDFFTLDPTGRFLYTVSNGTTSAVAAGWSLNQTTGALTALPGLPPTLPTPYAFVLAPDPSGKFLFTVSDASGLEDTTCTESQLVSLAINPTSGVLTRNPASSAPILSPSEEAVAALGQTHSTAFTLTGVQVSASSSTVSAGETVQFTAAGLLSDATTEYLTASAQWTSSNPSVAVVSTAGVAIALSQGSTTITACYNSVCGSAALTVTAGSTAPVSILPASFAFTGAGAQAFTLINNSAPALTSFTIRFSGADAGDFTETNTCGTTLAASVSCTISVTFNPSAAGTRSAELDVFDGCNRLLALSSLGGAVNLTSIAVTPVSSTIAAGMTGQFTATGSYSGGFMQNITNSVTWTSSDTTIATLSPSGLATGVKMGGPVNIQATLGGISSNNALLTVTSPALVSISITPVSTIVAVGMPAAFIATGTYGNGSEQNITSMVTWSSSDITIATIGATGVAAGVKPGTVKITAALAGASGSAMLRVAASGLVLTWGPDESGELGNGTIAPYSDSPVAVSGIQNAVAVALGGRFSLAAMADGTVRSWGFNNVGQLGNGVVTNSSVPQPGANLTGVIDVKAGIEFSLALKSDGTVWAWGSNSNGQLGNGTNTDSDVPIQVHNLSGVVAIAAGWDLAVALKSDGTVWAWGSGLFGELGNGANADSSVPVPVSGLTQTVAISGGQAQAYALKSDGSVWAWGYNGVGQLGNGSTNNSNVPVPVSVLTGVTAISAGNLSAFALRSDGSVWSWGVNEFGELGNGGSVVKTNIPAPITSLSGVSAIAAQGESAQALKSDGTLWAWGYGLAGELGNGANVNSNVPVRVSVPGNVLALGTGSAAANAIVIVSQPVSISITPASASITVGGKQLYAAVATYANGSTANVTSLVSWGTSDPTTVSIGASALALGLKAGGPVTITATLGGVTSNAASLIVVPALSGTVVGWGYNFGGQLGNGSNANSNVPVSVSGITGVVAVAGGDVHSLALKSDGTMWAWGLNGFGQLGIGSFVSGNVPVQVSGITGVIAVAAGEFHSLALKSDGTVWAWGWNLSGQLGTGNNIGSIAPIQIPNLTGVIAISAGGDYSLAVKSDGTLWAWGYNFSGQLGTGTSTDTNVPVQVSGITGAIAVAAGIDYTIALKVDGTVWAWGDNSTGELGTGNNTSSNVPVKVSALAGVVSIAAGGDHAQALKPDGSAWRWGYLNLPPSLFESNTVAIAESIGDDIDLKGDGTVWVTGFGNTGELGNGNYVTSPVPVQAVSLAGVLAIGAGPSADHVLAIVSAPVSISIAPASALVPVGGTQPFTATATYGNGSTANITNLVSWSASDSTTVRIGASGLAQGLKPGGPVTLTANMGGVVSNAASLTVTTATGGTVEAWGYNYSGQLGNGNTTNSNVPIPVNGLIGVVGVAAAEFNSLALKSDGTLWAWGENGNGQLGNGTTSNSDLPAQVPGLTGVVAAGVGFADAVALKSDGTVWAWGYNGAGQLGIGSTTDSPVPLPLISLSGVIAISAGDDFNLALKSDGTVWAWGENTTGELGNGTTTFSTLPVQVSGLTGVVAISAGYFAGHALALKSDGTVWAWGYNFDGELGTGNTTGSTVPVPVANLTAVTAISAGNGFSLALKSDGTVRAWGVNTYGQLGTGNNTSSSLPVAVSGLNGVVAIASQFGTSLALKADGTVWAWGLNDFGQLGNGSNANSAVPVQVPGLSGVLAMSRGSNAAHELAIVPSAGIHLTTAVSPPGAGTISPPTGTYTAGSNVTVTAAANPGYVFTGFSGALTGGLNPQTLTLDSDSAVTANFAPSQPSLTASVGLRTDGQSAGSRNVPVTLLNSGQGAAGNATIASISAITVLAGSGTVSVLAGTPTDLGAIAPANNATGSILFSWPVTATRVRFTVNFTADGGYSGSTIITSFR